MTTAYRIAIGVTVDSSGAKSGGAEASTAVAAIGKQAEVVKPKIEAVAAAIGKLKEAANNNTTRGEDLTAYGQEMNRLQARFDPLFAVMQRHRQALIDIGNAERVGAISASTAIEARIRETRAMEEQAGASERLAARRKQEAQSIVDSRTIVPDRGADIAAYLKEMDRLQARFDPMFALMQRHRQALLDINEAQRVGAISASTAIDARIRETRAMEEQVNATERLAARRKQNAQMIVQSAMIVPDRAADITGFLDQRDQLRQMYNPRYAALSEYKKSVADIREANKVGAISHDEMTAAIARQRQATLSLVQSQKGTTGSGNQALRPDQKTNLMYQAYDSIQGVALGMPLAQVAMQQGPQAIQIFGGVGNAAKAALAALTPVRLAIGGMTAVLAVGAMSWNDYLKSVKEVETAAAGLGRATAGSAEDMEAAAQAGAAAAGISVSSARSMEAQFLRTGKIGSENFEQLISISKNFGATIGVSADEAGTALATMFADPGRAIDTLYRQYGLIDAATAEYARRLVAQNRASDAQKVLLDALPNRLADASAATTALGRAWDAVTTSVSNAMDAIGRTVDAAVSAPTRDQQIEALQEGQANNGPGLWENPRQKMLREARERRAAAELQRLQTERARERETAAQEQDLERRKQPGVAALDIAGESPATATARARRQLEDSIKAMQVGQNAPGLNDYQRDDIAASIDAKTRALETMIPAQERANQLAALDIRIQTERNPVVLAGLMADRERLQLAGEEIKSGDASARISAARNRIIQETIASSQAQSAEVVAEVEARRRLNDQVAAGNITASEAEALLRTEIQLRPLAAAAAAAQGEEQKKLAEALEAAKSAAAASEVEQRRTGAIGVIKGQEDDLERLRLEKTLVGSTTAEREKALAVLQTEQMIRERGYSALSAEADAIRRNAREIANQTAEVERSAAAWQMWQSAGETAIDNVFGSLLKGDFKGALNGLLGDMSKFFQELGTNSIKNMLLGGDRTELSDVVGSLAKKFGAPAAAAATAAANDNSSFAAPVMAVTRSALSAPSAGASIDGATDVESFIRAWAPRYNVNADTAVAVARSEGGLSSWNMQSGVMKNGVREPSYGPFQLYKGGGLGNVFQQQTGLDPALAANGPEATKFALQQASQNGWGAWYGAKRVGIDNWEGIGKNSGAETSSAALEKLATAGQSASKTVGSLQGASSAAVKGLGNLGDGLGQMGQNMANAFPAAPTAGGGGFFSSLLTAFLPTFVPNGAQSLFAVNNPGTGLFDTGGWTGNMGRGDIAGFVHGQEYVVKADVVAKPGVRAMLEGLNTGRSYDKGGFVSRIGAPAAIYPSQAQTRAASAANDQVSSRKTEVNVYVDNPRGDRDIEAAVDRGVSKGLRAYDKNLPSRVEQIKKRPYVRNQ